MPNLTPAFPVGELCAAFNIGTLRQRQTGLSSKSRASERMQVPVSLGSLVLVLISVTVDRFPANCYRRTSSISAKCRFFASLPFFF